MPGLQANQDFESRINNRRTLPSCVVKNDRCTKLSENVIHPRSINRDILGRLASMVLRDVSVTLRELFMTVWKMKK